MNNRIKRVCITGNDLLSAFTGPKGPYCKKIIFPALPADYEVEHAYYDSVAQCWCIIVSHPSWPELSLGKIPETINSWIEVVQIGTPELNGTFVNVPSDKVPHISVGDSIISRESSKSIDTLRVINGGKTPEDHLKSLIEHAEFKCRENEFRQELKKHKEEEDEKSKDKAYYINLIKQKLAEIQK